MQKDRTLYIGLGCSFHDPSMAIVDYTGQVVFAEAAERYLQVKRAFNSPPDDFHRVPSILQSLDVEYSRVVLAKTWACSYGLRELLWLVRGHTSSLQTLRWLVPTHNAAVKLAGINLAHQLRGPLCIKGNRTDTIEWRNYGHHLTHAATGAFTSPFNQAAVAVIDGAGEISSTAFFRYNDGFLKPICAPQSVNSLGLFYALLCNWCGWDPFKGEEWKVMGLAAYGEVDPDLKEVMKKLIGVRGLQIIYPTGRREHQRAIRYLESVARKPDQPPLAAACLAATGQELFQEILFELLRELHRDTELPDLVLAGGCALNSACNGLILHETPFKRMHVPMAPADDGNALGAALLAIQKDSPEWTPTSELQSPYLGSIMSSAVISRLQRATGLRESREVCKEVARYLAAGLVVAWVQGRAEFGPRALGHRSILADPRSIELRARLNSMVKFREDFRPIAPAILDEKGNEWFESYETSPYMSITFRYRPEKIQEVPVAVHKDGTGRAQSVTRELEPQFHELLMCFYELTGVPILINTSLNVMGKPIVHSVEDVLGVFYTSDIDVLAIGDFILEKGSIHSSKVTGVGEKYDTK